MTNKEAVEILFSTLWTDPDKARSVCTDDVTWVTTRSMPIPGNEQSIYHVGFDAVLNVANSGKQVDNGYLPETIEYPHQQLLNAEDKAYENLRRSFDNLRRMWWSPLDGS